ncbi:MAG: formylglycine-generating enzyme family protein [Bacteroidales bacterium]|nr:formylglycine-generating enzyme family protein [Bacteroidales bacterium]
MKPFLFTLLIILGSINCYCQKLSENESIQSSPLPIVIDNKIYGYMIQVSGGSFQMGSNDYDNEQPPHTVSVNTFYIGETEVTQELWKDVMGDNPSYFKKGDNYPVENVFWNDCQTFIKKLNEKTGKKFRLPTEAEWEYAARGGKSGGTKYSGSDNIDDVSVYTKNSYDLGSSNSAYGTHHVKSKKPNSLGIYDMSGNVWEWCNDWYASDYYKNSPSNNPQGPSSGYGRVLRGGSWINPADYCRVANRGYDAPVIRSGNCGLRLALVP